MPPPSLPLQSSPFSLPTVPTPFFPPPFPTMSISIFLLWLVSIPLTIHAIPEQRGYFLNCGGKEEQQFGGVKYTIDEGFVDVGNKSDVKQQNVIPLLSTLRYFPNAMARKYCYNFQVFKGGKFMVKTIYYYGGFDGGKEPPVFDQIIDGTRWNVVNTSEEYKQGLTSYYEAIVVAQNKVLSVCLARNNLTTSSPFISALEVEYLDDSLYNSTDFGKYGLMTIARHSFGSTGDVISFPEDKFNRYWQHYTDGNPVTTSHSHVNPSAFWNIPPGKVFETAMTASRGKTLTLKWPPSPLLNSLYYIALYFQDSRTTSPYSWRVFDVAVNGQKFYSNLNVTTSGVTVYSAEWPLEGETEISLIPSKDSPVGPIINAGEVYQIFLLGKRTITRDVVAMVELARGFDNPPEDWHGDPCMPKENAWTGVLCSDKKTIRVVSLNLTGFGLSGTLSDSISILTGLSEIWLGDNKLSGKIPNMSQLRSLKILHLENNHFEGTIPESLGKLQALREVYLQNNNLNGTIPKSLKNKKDLKLQVSPGNHLSQ